MTKIYVDPQVYEVYPLHTSIQTLTTKKITHNYFLEGYISTHELCNNYIPSPSFEIDHSYYKLIDLYAYIEILKACMLQAGVNNDLQYLIDLLNVETMPLKKRVKRELSKFSLLNDSYKHLFELESTLIQFLVTTFKTY